MYELKLDGRPMSGDIGRGTTRETIAFAVHLAATKDRPHGSLNRVVMLFLVQEEFCVYIVVISDNFVCK